MKILLNKNWKINCNKYGAVTDDVPCMVLGALLKHKKIKDPYYRDNELKVQQLLYDDYTFVKTFVLTKEQCKKPLFLCFDGICTVSEIYVNNTLVAHTFDMHQRYKFQLNNDILKEENELRICFKSSFAYVRKYPNPKKLYRSFAVTDPDSPKLRQSNAMFGWDWGPTLPDMGLFRDVYLLSTEEGYVDNIFPHYHFYEKNVDVDIDINILNLRNAPLKVVLKGHGYVKEKIIETEDQQSHTFHFTIDNPALWYPTGYGEQNLYELTVQLGNQNYCYKLGIRKLVIDDKYDDYGRNYAVYINDVKIFIKGSNYIPEDALLNRLSRDRSKKLLYLAKNFNHNSIRIWGGGTYLDDYFYELCDEMGILVFHDLMFACATYDIKDQLFKDLIINETKDALRRLRSHPSIIVISGNNEIEDEVKGNGIPLAEQYTEMYHDIITKIVKEEIDLPFYTSSPTSGEPFMVSPNDPNYLDTHFWWVWGDKYPINFYRTVKPRFLSEFGMQSFATYDTILSFTSQRDRSIYSKVMTHYEKDRTKSNKKIVFYVKELFKMSNDLKEFTYLSMLMQAEAIKTCVENLRQNKKICNGALYWQLNDCWPGHTWSSIDYNYGLKALHYYSRHFYNPDLVSVFENDNGRITINISNDHASKRKYSLKYCYIETDKTQKLNVIPVEINEYESKDVLAIDKNNHLGLYVSIYDENNQLLNENHFLFEKDKNIVYPTVKIKVEKIDDYSLKISTDNFARGIYINCHNNDVILSDNFFNLNAGSTKIITANQKLNKSDLDILCVNNINYQEQKRNR